MTPKLTANSSPYIRSRRKSSDIMLDVMISLLPSAVAGCLIFGTSAAARLAVALVTAVVSEGVFCACRKTPSTVGDLSSAVTGLLVGLSVPANLPLWQTAFGSAFAVLVVKCIFGGIGYNIANPAIAARVFMLLSFGEMARVAYPVHSDAVSSATPLATLSDGGECGVRELFFGIRGGSIGEVCALAILSGLVYLLVRGVISWHIPTSFIGAVFILSLIYESGDVSRAAAWCLSGSALMGAVFLATDYVSSPTSACGKLLYGAGCGALTCLIRFFGSYPEGVSFAILFMNFTVPFIDIFTRKQVFGGGEKCVKV